MGTHSAWKQLSDAGPTFKMKLELCMTVGWWLRPQKKKNKAFPSLHVSANFVFSPNFLSSHFAQTLWKDENRFVFWHTLLTSSSFGHRPAQIMQKLHFHTVWRFRVGIFGHFVQKQCCLDSANNLFLGHIIWCFHPRCNIEKCAIYWIFLRHQQWIMIYTSLMIRREVTDNWFSKCSSITKLLQTWNSNHSTNRGQSISQSAVFDKEKIPKRSSACHVLQTCFFFALLNWAESLNWSRLSVAGCLCSPFHRILSGTIWLTSLRRIL